MTAFRIAISFVNTILSFWLAFMLFFNSDRRDWPLRLATVSLFASGVFFTSHTAILVSGISFRDQSTTLWLSVGMLPVVILPFAWYLVIIWYSGYWDPDDSTLYRRHRPILAGLTFLVFMGIASLIILGIPLFPPAAPLDSFIRPYRKLLKTAIAQIPLVVWGFPTYVLLSVMASLDALRKPGPSRRIMGSIARQRARKWLVLTSLMLLIVAILVAWTLFWTITNTKVGAFYVFDHKALQVIARVDLVITLCVLAAILMLGRAMVAYELFTGHTLPRRGLNRQWHRAIFLAFGYGFTISFSIALGLPPIYLTLITTVLLALSFAQANAQAYADRQRHINELRPFVSSQNLFDTMLTDDKAALDDVTQSFRALCVDILDTRRAHLTAIGGLAPLVPTLTHPRSDKRSLPPLQPLIERFTKPDILYQAVDTSEYEGIDWAIPLWGRRGLIGLLLLGTKNSGSLYTQEEIEIARATGSRLIDTLAGANLSRRLVHLQRERMATQQTIDQQSRRVLHDEVLPLLHTAMLSLNGLENGAEPMEMLGQAHKEVSDLLHQLPRVTTPDVARLGVLGALRRSISNEFGGAFDVVDWQVSAETDTLFSQLTPTAAQTVYYAARETVRNAAKYARRPNHALTLTVSAHQTTRDLILRICDDGVGITLTETESSGQGLALHSTLLAISGGSLVIDAMPNQYTCAQITIPADVKNI